MERFGTSFRTIVGAIFALGAVLVTAYTQTILHFNTYLALFICLIIAVIFCEIMVGRPH